MVFATNILPLTFAPDFLLHYKSFDKFVNVYYQLISYIRKKFSFSKYLIRFDDVSIADPIDR